MLYDVDILEESVLLDWSDRISRKYISRELGTEMRRVAEPLIKWLREAEEEDEDGDGSEDGEEDDLEVKLFNDACFVNIFLIIELN